MMKKAEKELVRLVMANEIIDAKTVIAVSKAKIFLDAEKSVKE